MKFGCDPGPDALRLIQATRDLNLELHGFSFHVGSPCGEVMAMSRGIGICKYLIEAARSLGCNDVQKAWEALMCVWVCLTSIIKNVG